MGVCLAAHVQMHVHVWTLYVIVYHYYQQEIRVKHATKNVCDVCSTLWVIIYGIIQNKKVCTIGSMSNSSSCDKQQNQQRKIVEIVIKIWKILEYNKKIKIILNYINNNENKILKK